MRKEKEIELASYIQEMATNKLEKIEENPKFLSLETYQCTLNNGKTIPREKVLKNQKSGSAVLVLPITKDNTTILTIQPRVFTKTTVGVSFPAGYVEEKETYEEAAKRELQEETGYLPEKMIECCSFYQDDGCSSAFNKGYIALNCERKTNQSLDSTEFIKYFECTWEELLELVERGIIQDGGSQLLIEKAKNYWQEKEKEHV